MAAFAKRLLSMSFLSHEGSGRLLTVGFGGIDPVCCVNAAVRAAAGGKRKRLVTEAAVAKWLVEQIS
jgi:hypothetical protein